MAFSANLRCLLLACLLSPMVGCGGDTTEATFEPLAPPTADERAELEAYNERMNADPSAN